jgi:hypothetical protein
MAIRPIKNEFKIDPVPLNLGNINNANNIIKEKTEKSYRLPNLQLEAVIKNPILIHQPLPKLIKISPRLNLSNNEENKPVPIIPIDKKKILNICREERTKLLSHVNSETLLLPQVQPQSILQKESLIYNKDSEYNKLREKELSMIRYKNNSKVYEENPSYLFCINKQNNNYNYNKPNNNVNLSQLHNANDLSCISKLDISPSGPVTT